MIKKIIAVGILAIILITNIAASTDTNIKIDTTYIKGKEDKNIKNITLEDDAFHKTDKFLHIETWYFDAVFTNNYSMAVIISVFQRGDIGFVLSGLYIYKDTELIYRPRTIHRIIKLSASEEKLDMKIYDETIMKCSVNNDTGIWKYQVIQDFKDVSINLNFENMTAGWKTNITGGWWLVSPRLNVTGNIILEGKNISVSGEGYHDHNWFYLFTPFIQKGWHFGNIAGGSMGVTWAYIIKNRFNTESIVVLNQKNKDPIEIDPEDVKITALEYTFSHGKRIPKKFILEIENKRLQVDVSIETLNTNHVRLPFLNYWRYHLRNIGTIKLDSVTENINNIGLSELMRFF